MNAGSTLLRCVTLAAALVAAPFVSGCIVEAQPDELADEGVDLESPEPTDTVDEGASASTVAQAAASSCATSSVKALSKQIIAEARCMNADAYVSITDLANVSWSTGVFPYLERPARDKLVAALKENPGKTLKINSALRTVAQQYMLYNWYQNGRCGIGLAAKPGNSNHETGLALDVSQYSTWKTILQNKGFKWLGSNDPVHFDYVGSGAVSYKGLDVKAFQRLWNRNNPKDLISVDGVWGPQTEARMKKSPAAGFAKGALCGTALQYGEPEETPPSDVDTAEKDFARAPNTDDGFISPMSEGEEDEVEQESCADHAL